MADANMVEAAPADMQRDVEVCLPPPKLTAPTFDILTRTRGFSLCRMPPVGMHLHALALLRQLPSKRKADSMPSLRCNNWMRWKPMLAMRLGPLA